MRKLILRMLLTVDGVAAGENGPIDNVDYGDKDSWRDTFATLETVDAMMLGAGAHEEYLDYWQKVLNDPSANPNEKKFAEIAARIPHYVLSRTPRHMKWPNASVLAGGVDGIAALKREKGGDILMWGGPTAAAAAIEAQVVDEYHLETHPTIAGRGKKLFDDVAGAHRLRQISAEIFPSGVLMAKYAHAAAS